MKKTNIVLVALMVASTVVAQERVADFPQGESQIAQELRKKLAAKKSILEIGNQMPIKPASKRAMTADADTISDPNFIGYTNPRGTFFLGLDEKGTGYWFKDMQEYLEEEKYTEPIYGFSGNGVIGAWSDTIKCWTWTYKGGDFKKVHYRTMLEEEYPSYVEDAFYYTDSRGNFHDSIVSAGGWTESRAMGLDGGAYELYDIKGLEDPCKFSAGMWQAAVPMQYTTLSNGEVKRYQMLRASENWDTEDAFGMHDYPMAIGGLPNAQTEDGLWPLTQAEPINAKGVSYVLGTGTNEHTKPYHFGAYTDSVPKQIVTIFDKPQAPLYIESITIPVGSQNYTNALTKNMLKIGQVTLEIKDMSGQVLATAQVSGTDKYSVTYKQAQKFPACMLKFSIDCQSSTYGEDLDKGILIKDSFQVVLSGFTSNDDFGIFAAKTTNHASNTKVIYASGTRTSDYEPYIMLNGIMTTWEPYANYALAEQYGYKTGVRGDTIDINFVTAQSPYYKYIAHYAGKDYSSGSEFDFYSSFVPYDSITRIWKLDMDLPSYVTVGGGYDENIGDEENPVTLWDYMRLFWMKIYAIDTPVIGDYIKIGTHGRYTYFHVVSVDGGTTPEEIEANQNKQHQSIMKVLNNQCQIRILKDGSQYDILGTKIQ